MRLQGQAKGGFYPTPNRVVEIVARLVAPSYGERQEGTVLRVIDPCCGTGEALALLADRIPRPEWLGVETYGVELHDERAKEATARLDNVLASDLFRASIATGAFSVMLLNPPYDDESSAERRTEHSFLRSSTRYLVTGGVLLYIIPRRRLALSSSYLAAHYHGIFVEAFPDPERAAFDQVVVFGRRKGEPTADPETEALLKAYADGEDQRPSLGTVLDRRGVAMQAPATLGGEVLFGVRGVDPVAAAAEARRSGLWADAGVTDALWTAGDLRTRPLMPLRRGHLAMLVAAGFLDNLELETDERRLIVKGRTTKELELVDEQEDRDVWRERLRTTVVAIDLDTGEVIDVAA